MNLESFSPRWRLGLGSVSDRSASVEFFLDDQPVEGALPVAALGVLLTEVRTRLAADGRIVVGVVCDGADVTGDGFSDALNRPVSSFARIEMHTAQPAALAEDAMTAAGNLLADSQEAAGQVVDLLASGQSESALLKLGECCRAWLQVQQGVCDVIGLLGVEADKVTIDGRSLPEVLALPIEQLKQIRQIVAARDFVLLSDLLTYELPDAIRCWNSVIQAVGALADGSE